MSVKAGVNFTDFFKNERDVYVQNLSNTQVVIEFDISAGVKDSVVIPRTRLPYNLTQRIPFAAIKNCIGLRRLVNRRPQVLKLMDDVEYMEFYEMRANENGTSVDEEIERAFEMQTALMNHTPPPDRGSKTFEPDEIEEDDEPQETPIPRIIHLCSRVGEDVEEKDRLGAREMKEELDMLEGELRKIDLEYVHARCGYKTIRKWATTRLEKLA